MESSSRLSAVFFVAFSSSTQLCLGFRRSSGGNKVAHRSFVGRTEWHENSTPIRGIATVKGLELAYTGSSSPLIFNLMLELMITLRPANRCRCLLVCVRKGIGWRCCWKLTGVPRSSASLPKTCTKEATENGGGEASGLRSDNTSSSTTRDPLSLHVSLLL